MSRESKESGVPTCFCRERKAGVTSGFSACGPSLDKSVKTPEVASVVSSSSLPGASSSGELLPLSLSRAWTGSVAGCGLPVGVGEAGRVGGVLASSAGSRAPSWDGDGMEGRGSWSPAEPSASSASLGSAWGLSPPLLAASVHGDVTRHGAGIRPSAGYRWGRPRQRPISLPEEAPFGPRRGSLRSSGIRGWPSSGTVCRACFTPGQQSV